MEKGKGQEANWKWKQITLDQCLSLTLVNRAHLALMCLPMEF